MSVRVKQKQCPTAYRRALQEWEAAFVRRVMRRAKGNLSLAARLAGIDRTTLYRMAVRARVSLPKAVLRREAA